MDIETIKNQFEEYMNRWDGRIVEPGMCGAIIGTLDKACGRKEDRHLVLKQLTGHTSSKELSPAQWYALYQMTMPYKPEGGKWMAGVGEESLEILCRAVLNASLDQPGQMKIEFPEFEALICKKCNGKGYYLIGSDEIRCQTCNALPQTSASDWEAHVESPKSQENPF